METESQKATSNQSNQNVSKKEYKCRFEGCKLEFLRPYSLKFHMNVHLKEKPFECAYDGCDKAYSNPSHLKRHELTHNNTLKLKKYRCKHCQEYFSTTSNLKRHIQRTHSESAKVCKVCSKRFRIQNLLDEHMKFHEKKGKELKSFDCEKCGKELKNWDYFIKHKRKHLKDKLQCPFEHCLAEFDTKIALWDHKVYFHAEDHVQHYTCAHCDRVFYTKSNLKRNLTKHVQISHLGRRFRCDVCNAKFASNQKLTQHKQNLHQGSKKSRREHSNRITCELE